MLAFYILILICSVELFATTAAAPLANNREKRQDGRGLARLIATGQLPLSRLYEMCTWASLFTNLDTVVDSIEGIQINPNNADQYMSLFGFAVNNNCADFQSFGGLIKAFSTFRRTKSIAAVFGVSPELDDLLKSPYGPQIIRSAIGITTTQAPSQDPIQATDEQFDNSITEPKGNSNSNSNTNSNSNSNANSNRNSSSSNRRQSQRPVPTVSNYDYYHPTAVFSRAFVTGLLSG